MPTFPLVASCFARNAITARASATTPSWSSLPIMSRAWSWSAGCRRSARGSRGERHEPGQRRPPRHVLDVPVEAAVLVHDDDRRQLAGRGGGQGQVALDLPRRARDGDALARTRPSSAGIIAALALFASSSGKAAAAAAVPPASSASRCMNTRRSRPRWVNSS
jgi:hypothetical protein